MRNFDDFVKKVSIPIEEFRYSFMIDVDFDAHMDPAHFRNIVNFYLKALCNPSKIIKVPETWWDAFKERWFPHLLLKRFPINYRKIETYNVCPHIKVPNKRTHMDFVIMEGINTNG